jgi:hypothetical protein
LLSATITTASVSLAGFCQIITDGGEHSFALFSHSGNL